MHRTVVRPGSGNQRHRNYKIVTEDQMHNNQDEEMHEGYTNISGRLPYKGDVESQWTASR